MIHGTLLTAAHAQPLPPPTATVPVAAAADVSAATNGEIEKLHGAPGCETVKVLPAIVSEPVLAALVVFA